MQKSAEACQREGVFFVPMVTKSFGGWHEVAVREVERLGAALARQSGQNEDEAVRHLWGTCGANLPFCYSEGMLPYWEIVCLTSLPLRLMADTEILRGFLGLRPS